MTTKGKHDEMTRSLQRTRWLAIGILCLASTCGKQPSPHPPATSSIAPVPIPEGYGFPGDRAVLQGWADAWDEASMRTHAWNVWAGMTADSRQQYKGAELPVWETWCGTEEVFPYTCNTTRARPRRAFQSPTQHSHVARRTGTAAPDDTKVVSFNKFNPDMASFLAEQHAGPGDAQYSYTSMQSLASLNAAWPQGTSIADRTIADAPLPAMALKPVVFVVKQSGLTPMPLWQGTSASTSAANATPETWTTCVLVDPAGASADPATAPTPATQAQIAQAVKNSSLSCQTYLYAPLATLYHFQLDADEAQAWNAVAAVNEEDSAGGLEAAAGDYAALVAMHVSTKEIENWTWQTFWWQPGSDTPNGVPGSKATMTDQVQGAWRNYAMCAAWHQTQGAGSKIMAVCWNPYLETSKGIPAGQSSNCMTCHGTATVGVIQEGSGSSAQITTLQYPESYTAPIDFDTDPQFASFTKTDFSWAIPDNATLPFIGSR